ncbi:MAG TPA: translation elongation factor Ts, partial [Alphaproteobacteria bacterium]|nr:translation elongation factor Ts [Alphaproteobacteria bacterium]
KELGDNIAMHIAAMKPVSVEIASLDKTLVERERAILLEQAKNSGQTGDILNKMVEGRLRKFYEDAVLLEQVYVVDGKTKISKLLEDLAAKLKTPIKIAGFVRMALGEGIEKEDKDFAAEVAAQLGR